MMYAKRIVSGLNRFTGSHFQNTQISKHFSAMLPVLKALTTPIGFSSFSHDLNGYLYGDLEGQNSFFDKTHLLSNI